MAVNQGGSQAVVLQLELFCASSSVSFSLSFLVFTRWHSPYQGYVKIVYSPSAAKAEWGGEIWGSVGGNSHCAAAAAAAGHARIHACTHMHQMVQEGGLNKHTRTDIHLLADRRLSVHRPLMNVYGESNGPSSFSWLSMRCSIMTMVIRSSFSPIIIHRSLCQSDSFLSHTYARCYYARE